MRMIDHNELTEMDGGSHTQAFSVEFGRKMFEILSSSLYTDKPLAVLRELSCNAADAHTSVGNPDPIEIHLPTALEPFLSVTDNGIGLSVDDVLNMYTRYGKSLKDHSNEMIGGFGLGSKAPFAYSDSFTATTRHNGVRATFAMYKSEAGVPTVTLTDQGPTDQRNGFSVTVPVKARDVHLFKAAAENLFRWWSTPPKTNLELNIEALPTVARAINVNGVFVRLCVSAYRGEGDVLIMGGVPYVIDSNTITALDLPDVVKSRYPSYRLLDAYQLVIEAPIGSVEINPGRERLDVTAKTKEFFVNLLTDLKRQFLADFQTQLDDIKDFNKWRIQAYKLGKVYCDMYGHQSFPGFRWHSGNKTYTLEMITTSLEVDLANAVTETLPVTGYYLSGHRRNQGVGSFQYRPTGKAKGLAGRRISALNNDQPFYVLYADNFKTSWSKLNFLANNLEKSQYAIWFNKNQKDEAEKVAKLLACPFKKTSDFAYTQAKSPRAPKSDTIKLIQYVLDPKDDSLTPQPVAIKKADIATLKWADLSAFHYTTERRMLQQMGYTLLDFAALPGSVRSALKRHKLPPGITLRDFCDAIFDRHRLSDEDKKQIKYHIAWSDAEVLNKHVPDDHKVKRPAEMATKLTPDQDKVYLIFQQNDYVKELKVKFDLENNGLDKAIKEAYPLLSEYISLPYYSNRNKIIQEYVRLRTIENNLIKEKANV